MTCRDIRCIRASSFQATRCQNHNLSCLLNNENLCSSWSFVRCSQKTTYDAEGYQKNPIFSLTLSWLRFASPTPHHPTKRRDASIERRTTISIDIIPLPPHLLWRSVHRCSTISIPMSCV